MDGDFFVGAALATTLTKLALRYVAQTQDQRKQNVWFSFCCGFSGDLSTYAFNSVHITFLICSTAGPLFMFFSNYHVNFPCFFYVSV